MTLEEKTGEVTQVGLSLALMTEFMNKIDKANLSLERLSQDVIELKEHSRVLNGNVAKHSSWIDRYDIRVSKDFETLQETVRSNDKRIYGFGLVFTVLNVCLAYVISIWKKF